MAPLVKKVPDPCVRLTPNETKNNGNLPNINSHREN